MSIRLYRILSVIGMLLALFALSGGESLATDEVVLIVKVAPGTDIAQLAQDYDLVLLDAIDALNLYRFQGFDASVPNNLAGDGRVLSVKMETDLESRPNFEAPPGSMDAYIRYIDAHIRYIDAHIRYIDAHIRYIDAHIRYIDAHIRYIDAHVAEYDDENNEIGAPYRGQPSALHTRVDQALDIATGENITVAVLDSGADLDHPLLVDNIVPGYDFVDGDADPSEVLDGLDNDNDGHVDEAGGHGTHVAGIVNLVAPSAKIMPIRIFDSEGHGTYFDTAAAIVYAVDQGVDVINLSGNGEEDSVVLRDAVNYAWQNGVIVVSAAGVNQVNYPGIYENVISVGAVDDNDYRTDFSRYQNKKPTVYAPGMDIFSAHLDGNLAEWTGNSMASPYVAGEVALMLSTGTCDFACAFAGVSEAGQPVADENAKRIDLFDAVSWAASDPQMRLKVQQNNDPSIHDPNDQHVKPHLKIVNLGTSLPMDELTLRYWFDADGEETDYVFNCDYALMGCGAVTAVFEQTGDGHKYAELEFANAGMLYGGIDGNDSGEIQIRMNRADWQNINETNHYSYNASSEYIDSDKITLYHSGELIWGIEPNGQAADMAWYDLYFPDEEGVPPANTEGEPSGPPPSFAPSGLSLQYFTNGKTAVANQISPQFQLRNDGEEDVQLSDISVRYWFPETQNSQSACDYALINCANTIAAFTDNYFELSFTEGAGILPTHTDSGTINLRIHKYNWTNYDQSTHHSFNPAFNTFTDWENVTLYYDGELIWGVEP